MMPTCRIIFQDQIEWETIPAAHQLYNTHARSGTRFLIAVFIKMK